MQKPILLFFLMLSVFQVSGQELQFGLRFSPQLSFLRPDVDNIDNDGMKLGMSYGLMTEFFFSENYALATGLGVNHTGGRFTAHDTINRQHVLNLQYIDVPVTLKMRTNEIGYITYFGQFGFNLGYNTRARQDLTIGSLGFANQDIKDQIYPFRAGLLIGAGAQYSLGGNTALLAGLHYDNGFTRLFRGAEPPVKHSNLALNLGILF